MSIFYDLTHLLLFLFMIDGQSKVYVYKLFKISTYLYMLLCVSLLIHVHKRILLKTCLSKMVHTGLDR